MNYWKQLTIMLCYDDLFFLFAFTFCIDLEQYEKRFKVFNRRGLCFHWLWNNAIWKKMSLTKLGLFSYIIDKRSVILKKKLSSSVLLILQTVYLKYVFYECLSFLFCSKSSFSCQSASCYYNTCPPISSWVTELWIILLNLYSRTLVFPCTLKYGTVI